MLRNKKIIINTPCTANSLTVFAFVFLVKFSTRHKFNLKKKFTHFYFDRGYK